MFYKSRRCFPSLNIKSAKNLNQPCIKIFLIRAYILDWEGDTNWYLRTSRGRCSEKADEDAPRNFFGAPQQQRQATSSMSSLAIFTNQTCKHPFNETSLTCTIVIFKTTGFPCYLIYVYSINSKTTVKAYTGLKIV